MDEAGHRRQGGDKGQQLPLALAFSTIERPQVAQRLILSVRKHFPTMPIYVADQSLSVTAMMRFYEEMHVTLVRMPYDAGVCASRNRLVERVIEDYFVLCDDDFVLGARTKFVEALRILEHHPDIGVVGGKLYDYDGRVEYARHWEMLLQLDRLNRSLTSIPIYEFAPVATQLGGIRFYGCDAVLNFALMRRRIFQDPVICWDERFKSNGEHEDFYLNMKLNSRVRVAYLPTMIAYHHQPMDLVNYRSRLRERKEGWRVFFEKWGIDQHLEIGEGVRTISDLGTVNRSHEARERFFLNESLSLHRSSEAAVILVHPNSSLSTAGSLDEKRDLQGSPQLRHSLVPSGTIEEFDSADGRFLFRYNPLCRNDADFVVWYRFIHSVDASNPFGVCVIHVRWTSDDGRIRIWASDRLHLDFSHHAYWVPLTLAVPLFPQGCAFMRFEIIAGEDDRQQALATGFLFKSRPTDARVCQDEPVDVMDVLALAPWSASSTGERLPPRFLDVGTYKPWERALTLAPCEEAPMVTLIAADQLQEWETVLLFGWDGLGSAWMTIPCDAGRSSRQGWQPFPPAAVPTRAVGHLRIVGFSKEIGYREALLESGRNSKDAASA